MIAHWAEYADDDYLDFVEEARPQVAQIGFYGAHFYSLVHTSSYKGYPAHFPVQGLTECGEWFTERNRQLHKRNAKVVGHFNCKFLVGDYEGPKGPTGFFKFYHDLWVEKELGPKPVANPTDLLEQNADGSFITQKGYGIGGMKEYWGCLLNPHWRTVLKAWVKQGIARGVDGYIVNYFYRHNCLCSHCQQAFRAYLKENYTPAQLKEFGIESLDSYKFSEIVAWHKPDESTPFRRVQLQFSQISNKNAIDDVMHTYGRSLKPDLIVAQWNHLGNISAINGDERCMLPAKLWGKDEDYLWYSTGASAMYTDLRIGYLGEGTLQCRYIRGAFDDKPYTLGKYEQTRIRTAIAELAANGGAPMGFYVRHKEPEARKEITRYYQFLDKYDHLHGSNRPHSEVLLLFPRTSIHQGDVKALDSFRAAGLQLLNAHVLFDILPDDQLTPDIRARYQAVVDARSSDASSAIDAAISATGRSRFDVPQTVRVSVNRSHNGGSLSVHFVNYDRTEPEPPKNAPANGERPKLPGRGIVDEKPIRTTTLKVDFVLPTSPAGQPVKVKEVRYLVPEASEPLSLTFDIADRRLRFTVPDLLVYGVAEIVLAP